MALAPWSRSSFASCYRYLNKQGVPNRYLILFVISGIFHVILRFPGILDWKFIMQNFEDHIQTPVKKLSSNLYGHLVVVSGEVVRKISVRKYMSQY